MGIDNESTGSALKKEMHLSYPVRDEVTGETITDPDGFPIAELESDDYLELANTLTIEERSRGERAWRFGHVIVDEAQDLTPMQWRMVSRRARGRSMTIVGDVAQRTVGESATWDQLLPEELGEVRRFDLSTNYRSPEEITPWARPYYARSTRISPNHSRSAPPGIQLKSDGSKLITSSPRQSSGRRIMRARSAAARSRFSPRRRSKLHTNRSTF